MLKLTRYSKAKDREDKLWFVNSCGTSWLRTGLYQKDLLTILNKEVFCQ